MMILSVAFVCLCILYEQVWCQSLAVFGLEALRDGTGYCMVFCSIRATHIGEDCFLLFPR